MSPSRRPVAGIKKVLDDPSEVDELPKGAMEDLLTVFATLYRTDPKFGGSRMPGIPDLQAACPQWPVTVITRALQSEKFAFHCIERGIPYIRSKAMRAGLTAEQMYVASIMLDMGTVGDTKARLRKAGISWATWQTWMKNPVFRKMIQAGADAILQDSYLGINRAMVQQAEKGDVSAAKFVFELTGRYDPNAKQVMEVQAVISSMLEIIQKNVTDPTTLSKIASDMQLLAARNGLAPAVSPPVAGEIVHAHNYQIGSSEA